MRLKSDTKPYIFFSLILWPLPNRDDTDLILGATIATVVREANSTFLLVSLLEIDCY